MCLCLCVNLETHEPSEFGHIDNTLAFPGQITPASRPALSLTVQHEQCERKIWGREQNKKTYFNFSLIL